MCFFWGDFYRLIDWEDANRAENIKEGGKPREENSRWDLKSLLVEARKDLARAGQDTDDNLDDALLTENQRKLKKERQSDSFRNAKFGLAGAAMGLTDNPDLALHLSNNVSLKKQAITAVTAAAPADDNLQEHTAVDKAKSAVEIQRLSSFWGDDSWKKFKKELRWIFQQCLTLEQSRDKKISWKSIREFCKPFVDGSIVARIETDLVFLKGNHEVLC